MSNAWHHAESSARRFGGQPEDYHALHTWFDASKEHLANFRHRALRHHTQGIFEAERTFGATILNSENKHIPVRLLGEQHVREDCGRIPSLADWLSKIPGESWMVKKGNSSGDHLQSEYSLWFLCRLNKEAEEQEPVA